jgi:hypothetical protein
VSWGKDESSIDFGELNGLLSWIIGGMVASTGGTVPGWGCGFSGDDITLSLYDLSFRTFFF